MTERTTAGEEERPERPRRSRVQDKSKSVNKTRRPRRRLRSLIITLLVILFLFAAGFGGMVFGYVVLGKQSWTEVLEWSTWRHVYDLVFAP
ncbi:DNA-directed RNA polymerase subunit beta [Paenibacillus caui]|uniref:DNA-directed RNA polymerase subunit beta n=1 Tax=Paenibacillus caui TaxID=2873927 RepID=UPI001CA9C954|nr:DNA-directed RNA polymerase subunit beta [Paenibacillus caui]